MQDEIWSEGVLKRLRTVRERTKEGFFWVHSLQLYEFCSKSQVHCSFFVMTLWLVHVPFWFLYALH